MKKNKIIKHLKEDAKMFKKEAREDKELIKRLSDKKSKSNPKKRREAARLKKDKIKDVMHEFKEGKLHSGSKKGPVVTKRPQAIAIALSESKKASKKRNR